MKNSSAINSYDPSQDVSKWLVAITVMLPTLIEIIDTSVVNVSLNHIRGSLSAGIDEATWTITSYLVSNAIIIPMTGWLSAMFGRKRYLVFSISLFTISSLLCGAAWSLPSLVVFRVLQGIGGGALQPLSQSILLETFPRKQHGTAMALFGVGIMFGPIIGPLLGGWITDNWSWHWIFFINVPIGVVSVILVALFIRDPHYVKRRIMKIDYAGLSLLALGLGCLQIVLDKGQRDDWFASGLISALTAVSALSLILFLINEYFLAEHPIVNLKVFKNYTFTFGNVIMFFAFFNLFGSIVLLPVFVQRMMGYTATLAGLVLGPGGIATLLAMPVAGRLVNKINPKFLLGGGIILGSYATWLMSRFTLDASFYTILVPRIVLGCGMGLLFIPLTTTTMSVIPREDMGNATAVYNLLRNLGGSFGVAFVTTLEARREQIHQAYLVGDLTPFSRQFQIARNSIAHVVSHLGQAPAPALTSRAASGSIYMNLMKQAAMLAFNDSFRSLSFFMLLIVPLVFMMKRGRTEAPPGAH